MTLETIFGNPWVMAALVFITAGLAYSFAGYKAKLSKYLRGDPSVKFNLNRIARTAGLGVFLGLCAFASEELLNGEHIDVEITNPSVFAKQVGFTMGLIYAVDKLIIAGSDGGHRRSSEERNVDLNANTSAVNVKPQTDKIPESYTVTKDGGIEP